jgi:hypothetical protein
MAAGESAAFLDSLRMDAVEYDPARVVRGLSVPLGRQLIVGEYCTIANPTVRRKCLTVDADGASVASFGAFPSER